MSNQDKPHPHQQIINKLIEEIEKEEGFEKSENQRIVTILNRQDIFRMLRKVMEKLEVEKITGNEKKEIAEIVLRHFVGYIPDPNIRTVLLAMIDNGFVSDTIDLVIDATKEKLNVNLSYVKKLAKYIFRLFCGHKENKKPTNPQSDETNNENSNQNDVEEPDNNHDTNDQVNV